MKKRSRQGRRQFQLHLLAYGNYYYIERIARLEAALKKIPRSLQINMVGVGEIPADTALLIRSVLIKRSPKTRIITNARNSLQGGSVLVWLLGDQRIIRAPGSNVTLAAPARAEALGSNKGSMRTVPVNQSAGPLIEGCEPILLISIGSFCV